MADHETAGGDAPPRSGEQTINTSESPVAINFDFAAGSTFIRTRHNNLRCFPKCSPVHKQNAFCGSPVYVKIKKTPENSAQHVDVYAGFHLDALWENDGLSVGSIFNKDLLSRSISSEILQARMYKQDEGFFYLIFMPDGKWTYGGTLNPLDQHYFTIYYVLDGHLQERIRSPMFHVIPTWKAQSAMSTASTTAKSRTEAIQQRRRSDEEPSGIPTKSMSPLNFSRSLSLGGDDLLGDTKRMRTHSVPMDASRAYSAPGQSGIHSGTMARFSRPPLLQTSLPYSFPQSKSVKPSQGVTPSSAFMPPPPMPFSPSLTPGMHFQGLSPSDFNTPHFFSPLGSPFGQVNTISPQAAMIPGFQYFAVPSPRFQQQPQQQQQQLQGAPRHIGEIPPEFTHNFSPRGAPAPGVNLPHPRKKY